MTRHGASTPSDGDALIERIERALSNREEVGRAVGILMERFDLDADSALATISQVALEEGCRVADVVTRLLSTRRLRASATVRSARSTPSETSCFDGAASGSVPDLSPREVEVLAMVSQGATNAEIASALFLSLNTVKTYIRTGYRKIGATRRAQAVIWARENGLADSATSRMQHRD